MTDLELNGIKIRVMKYKVVIYDEGDKITSDKAATIGIYLREEGFIDKDEFPIEIVKP